MVLKEEQEAKAKAMLTRKSVSPFADMSETRKSMENANWERRHAPTATTRNCSMTKASSLEKAEKAAEANQEDKKMEAKNYQLIEVFGSYDGNMDVFRQFPHYAIDECDYYRILNAGADPMLFYKGLADDYVFVKHANYDGYALHVKPEKTMTENDPMDCEPNTTIKCYL